MRSILAAAVAAFAVSTVAFPLLAGSKKCPDGTYYDESRDKCVTKRGS